MAGWIKVILLLVALATGSGVIAGEKTTRPPQWPISLDETTGAVFEAVGLRALGHARLQDGVISLNTGGDGIELSPGQLERFVVELDLEKPESDQSLQLRFLATDGSEIFTARVQGGGGVVINGTEWTPRDFSSEVRARFLFAVDQKVRRAAVLVQYATASEQKKSFGESDFVSYLPQAPIERVQLIAEGDGGITIRELNVFRPDLASIGDSTCQGGQGYAPIPTLTQGPRSWSFQYNLEKQIDPPWRVTNLGFSGHRISSMKQHVERAEKLGARVCIAVIGVNSVTMKKLSDEEICRQYEEWVRYAVSKGLHPVCCTMFPKSYGKDSAAQAQYDMLNAWIRKNVPQLGGEVIELHDQMVGSDGITTPRELTSDGHHPNPEGYRKAAGIIRSGLDPVLKSIALPQ